MSENLKVSDSSISSNLGNYKISSFMNIFTLTKNVELISKLKALSEERHSEHDIESILKKVPFVSEKLDAAIENIEKAQAAVEETENTLSDIDSRISELNLNKDQLTQEIEAIKLGDTSSLEADQLHISDEIIQTFMKYKQSKSIQLTTDIDLLNRRSNYEKSRLNLNQKNLEKAFLKYQKLDDSAEKILDNLKKVKLFLEKEALKSKIEADRKLEESEKADYEFQASETFTEIFDENYDQNVENSALGINSESSEDDDFQRTSKKTTEKQTSGSILSSHEYQLWKEALDRNSGRSRQNYGSRFKSSSSYTSEENKDDLLFKASPEDIEKYSKNNDFPGLRKEKNNR